MTLGPLHIASIAIFTLICVGVALRRNRRVHPPIMVTAFVLDVLLVLAIELSKGAFEEVDVQMSPFLLFHIVISTLAVLLYFPLLWFGRKLLRGDGGVRTKHRRIAYAFLALRFTNLVTSLMISPAMTGEA